MLVFSNIFTRVFHACTLLDLTSVRVGISQPYHFSMSLSLFARLTMRHRCILCLAILKFVNQFSLFNEYPRVFHGCSAVDLESACVITSPHIFFFVSKLLQTNKNIIKKPLCVLFFMLIIENPVKRFIVNTCVQLTFVCCIILSLI